MTTYTITGTKLSGYVNDLPTVVESTELKVVFADAVNGFSYRVLEQPAGNVFPIEITGTEPYSVTFDGVADVQVFDSIYDGTYTGFMSWPAGTAYILDFYSDSQGADYVFQMGGTPLPELTTAADATAFYQSLTGIGGIGNGPYGPGQEIPMSGFQNVQVTEDDVIYGDKLNNTYHAGLGNDVVHGALGNDRIYGNQGADKLWGEAGADRLFGGIGNDKLYGGVGRDVLNGGTGRDKLFGGGFHDTLYGNGGNDLLAGNKGNDKMFGGFGSDRLLGGLGADRMFGGGGNDKLNGGAGNDFMRGGAGADVFIYNGTNNQGADVIGDFTIGVDQIRIGGPVVAADLTIEAVTGGTLVSWSGTSIKLLGVVDTDLTFDSFDFV